MTWLLHRLLHLLQGSLGGCGLGLQPACSVGHRCSGCIECLTTSEGRMQMQQKVKEGCDH
jgi:hypothetical protein